MQIDQGSLCPHCGHIVMMPVAIDPICICCGKDVTHEEDPD